VESCKIWRDVNNSICLCDVSEIGKQCRLLYPCSLHGYWFLLARAMSAGCSMRWKAVFIGAANYNPIIIRFRWICHKIAYRSCGNYANSVTIPGATELVVSSFFDYQADLMFDASTIEVLTKFTTVEHQRICDSSIFLALSIIWLCIRCYLQTF